ncbi:probable methyltransferase-like protein 25 [Colias croceus]|uniref:probable methyltransferase-like protein 25 n=1 Tax=Colias crocea TaxID=72248 RepID=UPI001E27A03C|nr:probable methyltransferase-like protein 25 [Colias croceus]
MKLASLFNILKTSKMDTKIYKIQRHLDSIVKYLKPLLPLANCHMVEFFTDSHWELLPRNLRMYLDSMEMSDAVNKFWSAADNIYMDNCEIFEWVTQARKNCIIINNDYIISPENLKNYIKLKGGEFQPEIKVTQFMTTKKSYEVQTMSKYVASLHKACSTTHCIEAGGGKGNLLVALSLGYNIPSLTVDCDEKTLMNAETRVSIIRKQWKAIAKKLNNGTEEIISGNINTDCHRFAKAFITKDTDFVQTVKQEFDCDIVNVLLTGLHTCGNLGPDSLRIFTKSPNIGAVFNVPCCYHLLNEAVDVCMVDVFQREYGGHVDGYGFPMSEYLRGFNIGRNARMLASQSIHRFVAQKTLPDISLLYRAVLQTIIKKQLPQASLSEKKLKGLSAKCNNFKDYCKMANEILQIGLFDTCQSETVNLTDENMDCQWKKIVLFYMMRLCLAQVVESVILLDRLLFLYENGYNDAFIVKLFDPVLSPRCHSIVAIK